MKPPYKIDCISAGRWPQGEIHLLPDGLIAFEPRQPLPFGPSPTVAMDMLDQSLSYRGMTRETWHLGGVSREVFVSRRKGVRTDGDIGTLLELYRALKLNALASVLTPAALLLGETHLETVTQEIPAEELQRRDQGLRYLRDCLEFQGRINWVFAVPTTGHVVELPYRTRPHDPSDLGGTLPYERFVIDPAQGRLWWCAGTHYLDKATWLPLADADFVLRFIERYLREPLPLSSDAYPSRQNLKSWLATAKLPSD